VGFLAVIGLVVFLIVALADTGLRTQLVDVHRDALGRQLTLAESLLEPMRDQHPDSVATFLASRLGHRVTIIAPSGEVLGDSDVERAALPTLENHRMRPEVQGALGGEVSFAQRRSVTVGRRLLYGARPVVLAGQPAILRVAASLDDIDATVGRSQRAVAVAGLIGIVLALIVSYLVSRGLASPLVTLSRQARALASGDFTRRAARLNPVAELDDLAVSFNRLADELQTRLSELGRERDEMRVLIDNMVEGVVAISDDRRVIRCNRAAGELLAVSTDPGGVPIDEAIHDHGLRELLLESIERPVSTREMTLAGHEVLISAGPLDQGGAVATFLDVTELRRLEQVRQDFVANASHELKTPLTALRGWAETLAEDEPPPELRRQFLASIQKNTVRLQRLVEDLLDLSRLESGAWVVQDEVVALRELVTEVWEEFADRAEAKKIKFAVAGTGSATADSLGVAQVLRNLFDNALRYVPEGGAIIVDIKGDRETLTVAVSDNGTGIAAEALPRIFERFYRVDPARSREEGGTGLGLAIVRHLVSAMGGRVKAESELGKGTTIRFTLPEWRATREEGVADPVAVSTTPYPRDS
jgi:two-component system phosphate regulon sensor histidine kinase PhoR